METITAVYDGRVFVPEGPVNLEPNARVKVTMDSDPAICNTPKISKEERQAAMDRLLSRARHGGGAEFDRGDIYP